MVWISHVGERSTPNHIQCPMSKGLAQESSGRRKRWPQWEYGTLTRVAENR